MKSSSFARRCAGAVRNRVRGAYLLHVKRDEQTISMAAWRKARGDQSLRFDYRLDAQSVVLDIGGFRGDWAETINSRYGATVHIFEPIAEFAGAIGERFRNNPRISVHPFGIGDADGVLLFDKSGDASRDASIGEHTAVTERAEIRNINTVLAELALTRIDLIKINIEGGEYPLLTHMIETGTIALCQDIQVQFHSFVPNAHALRTEIRAGLARTHHVTYEFPFVWENWHIGASE